MKPKHVLEGWYNLLFKDERVEEIAKTRAEICYRCEHRKFGDLLVFLKSDFHSIQDFKCELCSCPLSAKIRSLDSKCDANKW